MLDSQKVHEVFMKVLFNDAELVDGKPPADFIRVDGITQNFGLHPERVAAVHDDVTAFLRELDDRFMESNGGGWSFLQLCNDKDGELWTGDHAIMQELCVLAIATKQGRWCMPRELWPMLPGGVPYVVFNTEVCDEKSAGDCGEDRVHEGD
jgi:hypothetical protein